MSGRTAQGFPTARMVLQLLAATGAPQRFALLGDGKGRLVMDLSSPL